MGDTRLADGLVGDLGPAGAGAGSVAGAAAIFAGVVGLLAVGTRSLNAFVRKERNEAYIRDHLGAGR